MSKIAIILINYKDYAKKYLDDCLESIRRQDFSGEISLYIVDNETSDESFNYLKDKAPEAIIIKNKNNDGFAKGNNDALKLSIEEGLNYSILLNMDTISESNAISEMIKMAESDESIGVVQSRLMLWPEKQKINSIGNDTHFLGFGFCRGYNDLYKEEDIVDGSNIFYPSGAAVLFKNKVLEEISLFDEKYFMYNEDQDLGWRTWLAGYKCVLAKNSVVYHKYEFGRSISKYYFMDKNRIITALKNYKIASLLIFLPAFVIMEIGLFYFSIKNKWLKEKIRVWKMFFSFSFWRYIRKKRKEVNVLRKVKDYKILSMISGKIWYQEISSPLLSVANIFLNIYFILAKNLLRLLNI